MKAEDQPEVPRFWVRVQSNKRKKLRVESDEDMLKKFVAEAKYLLGYKWPK